MKKLIRFAVSQLYTDTKRWVVMTAVVSSILLFIACGGNNNPTGNNQNTLTGTVSITGIAQAGQTLTANINNLGGSGAITFRWLRNGTTFIGTNSNTYILEAADVDSTISVTVTRADNLGEIVSEPTGVVRDVDPPPAITGTVSITGTAEVGQTLTADTGSLGGSGVITFQWLRNDTTTIGSNSSTYIVQSADAGSTITVIVTRSDNTGSVASEPTTQVKFLLTVNASPEVGGTISPADQLNVVPEVPFNIEAMPANGYGFVNWTVVNGTATFGNANDASTTVMLSANTVIRANFQTVTLTVNASPEIGGTVSPADQLNVAPDVPFNITATPANDYRFVNWTVVSGTATFGNANDASTTVTLSVNATIRANFQTFTLTVNANPTVGGTVSPASQVNVNPEIPVANIAATPASGYRFVNWTVVIGTATFDNANDASTTVTLLSANATIRANFEQLRTLTVTANPVAGGTVSPTSQSGIVSGEPVNITAIPNSDYVFVNWTVVSGTAVFGNANDASTTVTLSANATIRANFQTFTLTVNRNPTAGGTVSPASQVNVNPEVPIVNITAEPASGYRFVDWTVVSGTATFDNANDASTTVTLGSNATIRANFQTFTLTVNRNPTAGGTVSPASQVNVNPEIPIVNITATSASGHRFVNWTVVTGTATFGNAESASTTVTLSSNATIRANFKISHLNPNISYGFFTDPRDNQRYHTIVIGNQRWFAENLNFSGSGGVCYDNNPSNCDTYGRLYTWAEAMNLSSSCNNNSCASQVQSNHQGACPVGWRVPSDADWTTLANFVGSAVLVPDFFAVGTRLKSRTGWEGFGNVNGTDEFGFSALPGGYRFHNGTTFVSGGSMGLWWSSVESSPATYALGRTMHSVSGSMNSLRDLKNLSISLRCIEN